MMNANLTTKIIALAAYAVEISDSGFKIPDEIDAEINELIASAEEFALTISNAESDAAILGQLTEMLDAIKAELSAPEVAGKALVIEVTAVDPLDAEDMAAYTKATQAQRIEFTETVRKEVADFFSARLADDPTLDITVEVRGE